MSNTESTFDSLKSLPSIAPSFGSVSRTSLQTATSSHNQSMNRVVNMFSEPNHVLSHRTASDHYNCRTSFEVPAIDKCFGFNDDENDDEDDENDGCSEPSLNLFVTKKGQSSALSKVRASLKRFLNGPSSASSNTQPSKVNTNKRPVSNLFKSPTKDKPANVFDIFDKNKQKTICSALEMKSSNDNIEPSTSNANQVVLFEQNEIVSV